MKLVRRSAWLVGALALGWALFILVDGMASEVDSRREQALFDEERAEDAAIQIEELAAMPPELMESSGLVVSPSYEGVLWSHNDSGDGPLVYRFDRTGTLGSVVRVDGADAIDWESMDVGPCPAPGAAATDGDTVAGAAPSCLYMADVGDNARERTELQIYVLAEPSPELVGDVADPATVPLLGVLRLEYPDEAHDAEALAMTSSGGLVLVTKGRTPNILLYHAEAPDVAAAIASGEVLTLPEGVPLPIVPNWNIGRAVTGAGFNANGEILAVRTYSEIYFYRWPMEGSPEAAAPTCFLGPTEPQGEAVAFEEDGAVLLTSEDQGAREGMLLRVRCRGVAPEG